MEPKRFVVAIATYPMTIGPVFAYLIIDTHKGNWKIVESSAFIYTEEKTAKQDGYDAIRELEEKQ